MRIITCNLCGKKHSKKGVRCEDSVFALTNNGIVSVAVADGAGSNKYPHAKQGADAVTKAICEFLCERFDEFFSAVNELEIRKVIAAVCRKALNAEAEKLNLRSIETMASTLLCIATNGNKMIVCHIGDGVIGKISNGIAEAVTLPQSGEFASTTFFINSPDAYQMLQIRRMFLYSESHLFLMTDGVSDLIYNDYSGEFDSAMVELAEFSEMENGSELLENSIKKYIVDSAENSDDSTIAIIKTDVFHKVLTETVATETNTDSPLLEAITDKKVPTVSKPVLALSATLIVVFSILVAVLVKQCSDRKKTTLSLIESITMHSGEITSFEKEYSVTEIQEAMTSNSNISEEMFSTENNGLSSVKTTQNTSRVSDKGTNSTETTKAAVKENNVPNITKEATPITKNKGTANVIDKSEEISLTTSKNAGDANNPQLKTEKPEANNQNAEKEQW